MVKIRYAGLKDVPVIVDLWKEFMTHDKNLPRTKKMKIYIKLKPNASVIFTKSVRSFINSKNSAIFLAEHENSIVGYCLIRIQKNNPIYKIKRIGFIDDIYVKTGLRKKGIGTLFLRNAYAWFKKNDVKHLALYVDINNKIARHAYIKRGFEDDHMIMRRNL